MRLPKVKEHTQLPESTFSPGDVVTWHIEAGEDGHIYCDTGVGVVVRVYLPAFYTQWVAEIKSFMPGYVAYPALPFTVLRKIEQLQEVKNAT